MVVNSRRAAHAADTRRALVTAARRLFALQGYAATSLDEVCERARVTKGALYHHFQNKEDLFAAVLAEVEDDFLRAGMAAAPPGAGVWESLRAAGGALLDACARSDTRRVVLEAPAVLGWERCRQVEIDHAVGLLEASLEQATKDGMLACDDPSILAQLLAAVFNEAGMIVASAVDTESTHVAVTRELNRVLDGLQSSRSPRAPATRRR